MIQNSSAPPGQIVARLIYEDVATAIDWLCGAFGFSERLRTPAEPDGTIHHAQLAYGQGSVILTGQRAGRHEYTPGLMLRVDNVDAHCERAKQHGARIVMPPGTKEFGERQYSAVDFAGQQWTFTESVDDVPPQAWGAHVGKIRPLWALLPSPRFCYMEIPAIDVHQSAAFYEAVFGWNIRHRDTDRPSFDDAAGYISGAWVTGRAPSREPGLLPYVWVVDIEARVAKAAANGGEIVEKPHPDHPGGDCLIAIFRDPAGNLIGLYQEPV